MKNFISFKKQGREKKTLLLGLTVLLLFSTPVSADSSNSSTTSLNIPPCTNLIKNVTAAMNNGAQEGIKAVRSVMDTAQPSNIKQFYCIGNELQLLNFSNLGAMLLGAMQTVIDSIVSQIETAACQYVQATVNNVLVKLCLPMPQIGMIDLGLSAPAMKSCNGIQLAKVPNGVQPYLEKNVDVYFKNAADTLGLSGAKAANTYNSTPILK